MERYKHEVTLEKMLEQLAPHMNDGEEFIRNIEHSDKPGQDAFYLPSQTVNKLLEMGNFSSVRLLPVAYDADGTNLSRYRAIVGVRKTV